MNQALYRRFRPETFGGILGQDHIVRILQNQIRGDAIGHAYLFCGTRGTGKTTTARILAKGANCTSPIEARPCGNCENCIAIRDGIFLDVIEIDAASNNGVENIRELRESVKYAPVTGRYKVYIIDEVHMLSAGAYNALLKTLEEPPEYVIFILATTEPQKLPATVLSRCMRLDFRRVSEKLLIKSMGEICQGLAFEITDDALAIIAANGDGSVRDSLSLLDQCLAASDKTVSREDVLNVLGTKGEEAFIRITDLVEEGKVGEILVFIEEMLSEGIELGQFIRDWMGHYRNLMMIKFVSKPENILNLSMENIDRMREQSSRIQMSTIDYNILQLANTALEVKWSSQARVLLELCAVRLAAKANISPGELSEKKGQENSETRLDKGPIKESKEVKVEPKEDQLTKREQDPKSVTEEKIQVDLDKLWNKIVEEGASQKGSLRILGNRCRPICIEGNCLRLELDNEIAMRYVNDNNDMLRGLIEKHMGRVLVTECILSQDRPQGKQTKTVEERAKEVGNRLNINVEVK